MFTVLCPCERVLRSSQYIRVVSGFSYITELCCRLIDLIVLRHFGRDLWGLP